MASVLIVDDDPIIQVLLQRILENSAFTVHVASSVREAAATLGKHLPDAILLDLHLPDRDGFTLLHRMKEEPSLSRVPVVMLTSDLNRETVMRARTLQAADYIAKPFKGETVVKKLLRITALARLERKMNIVKGSAQISVDRHGGMTIFKIDGDFSMNLISKFNALFTEHFRKSTRHDRYVVDLTAQPEFQEEIPLLEKIIDALGRDRVQFLVGRNYAVLMKLGMEPEHQLFVTMEDLERYNERPMVTA